MRIAVWRQRPRPRLTSRRPTARPSSTLQHLLPKSKNLAITIPILLEPPLLQTPHLALPTPPSSWSILLLLEHLLFFALKNPSALLSTTKLLARSSTLALLPIVGWTRSVSRYERASGIG
jgi:hypothetical protein